ncbi:MAG: hypothetical protein R3A80_07415 [Bdellovibrionota bacterium]
MNVFARLALVLPFWLVLNMSNAQPPNQLPTSQPAAAGAANGVKFIDPKVLDGAGSTPVIQSGNSPEAGILKEIEQLQPPQAQQKVKDEIQAAAQGGKVEASKVEEILQKAKLEMAQEKLKELSQAKANTAASTGASSGSFTGGGHGSSGPASSIREAYQPRDSSLQQDISKYSSALADYAQTSAGLLSDKSLANIQSSFVDFARNSIDMPRGKEKSLQDNFLFNSLNEDTQKSLKDSFLGLVKNSALDASPSDDIPYLKDIISDSNFQASAEKILGPDNLSYLNLATISADMLNVNALTGAAYSTYLSLTEGTIAGARASTNVTEWMQAASFLTSKTFLDSLRNKEFSDFMRNGYLDLNDTYKRLAALKSLDFLDLLESPEKMKLKNILDAGVINSIGALRQAKRLKARPTWDQGILSNFNYFQKHIQETLDEASKVASSEDLLGIYDKALSNNSFRAYWRSFDFPGYFKFRRSVGSIYFAAKFKDFNKFKITPQTAPSLTYRKVPPNYRKDNAMFFVTATAMQYVKNQKERSRRLAEQEKEGDKRYSVNQLASDKYYINLEDELN